MAQRLQSMDELFKGRHFEREVIVLSVRWYLRFKLSLRDLVEMMSERGLALAHTTVGCRALVQILRNAERLRG